MPVKKIIWAAPLACAGLGQHPQVQAAGLAAGEPNLQPPGNWLLFASKTRSTNRFAGWTSFHRRSHRAVSVCCRAAAQQGGRVLGPALQEHLLLRYQRNLMPSGTLYSNQVLHLDKPVAMGDQFKQNSLQQHVVKISKRLASRSAFLGKSLRSQRFLQAPAGEVSWAARNSK